ncbi:MAG: hypothetical protein WCT77_05240 [Bacteroidota bacterium]|jgi:hypothetical protein
MKKNFVFLIITVLIGLSFKDTIAQQSKVEKEFEQYWKVFQKAVKEGDKIKLSELINFDSFSGTKEDFIRTFKKNEPFEGITRKQIINSKISKFTVDTNGIHAFDPYIDKEENEQQWKETNILNFLPVGAQMYLIIYQYKNSYAGTTLVFAKKDGIYLLWWTRLQPYD